MGSLGPFCPLSSEPATISSRGGLRSFMYDLNRNRVQAMIVPINTSDGVDIGGVVTIVISSM